MSEAALSPQALMREIGAAARRASRETARAAAAQKNDALERIASMLLERRDEIQAANAVDLENEVVPSHWS